MSEFYPDSHSDTEEDVKLVKCECKCKKTSCKVCHPPNSIKSTNQFQIQNSHYH